MALSTVIVQSGIATIREVEEALARQVLYGGDLPTNLLEVGSLDEAALLGIVSESLGLPAAPAGPLALADAEVLHLIAADVAHHRGFVPLAIEGGTLVIAVADRLPKEALRELSFALSLPVSLKVALHVRVQQALERAYGVPLDRRCERVVARMEGRGGPSSSLPANVRPDLVSPPRPRTHVPAVASEDVGPRPRMPTAPAPARPSARPTGLPPRGTDLATFVREGRLAPPRTERRRRGPLTSDVAKKELAEVHERDAIFEVVFDFAKQYFDYAAFFTVHADAAEGRDAFGEGAPRERVGRMVISLEVPGMLAMARGQKTALVVRPSAVGPDAILMADLGRTGHFECSLVPLVVRGRVVAIVLGDGGSDGVDATTLGEIVRVSGYATAAFERLLVQRKQGASSGPTHRRVVEVPEGRSAVDLPAAPNVDHPTTPAPPMGSWPSAGELSRPVEELAKALDAERPPPMPEESDAGIVAASDSGPPPPPNVAVVRRPSGAPIPREEPGSVPPSDGVGARKPSRRRSEAPSLDFGPKRSPTFEPPPFGENAAERHWLAEIQGRAPHEVLGRSSVDADPDATPLAPSVEALHPDATPAVPSVISTDGAPETSLPSPSDLPVAPPRSAHPRVMPASEQRVSVAPHKPPVPRRDGTGELPSIIVDVLPEYASVVARLLQDGGEAEENSLLRGGEAAMPAIMEPFPGPARMDLPLPSEHPWPRASECGPLLRIIARQRRTALPFVLEFVEDDSPERRFWATYLLAELPYVEAIEPALLRLFDEDPRVRRAASLALVALADMHPRETTAALARIASHEGSPSWQRLVAIEALGATTEPLAVGVLVPILRDEEPSLKTAAHRALVRLSRQDFGESPGRWESWWRDHEHAHRIEWLIDALTHEELVQRAAASSELAALTKESFGYADDLPKRDRERAQLRYRTWWNEIGRIRFHRDDTRLR